MWHRCDFQRASRPMLPALVRVDATIAGYSDEVKLPGIAISPHSGTFATFRTISSSMEYPFRRFLPLILIGTLSVAAAPIDREALVRRHKPGVRAVDYD
jgi:hypothetical protein